MLTVWYLLWPGFESPGEWEDYPRIFGVEGPDIQYTVSWFSSLACMCLSLSYVGLTSDLNSYFSDRVHKMKVFRMYITHLAMDLHSLHTIRTILIFQVL